MHHAFLDEFRDIPSPIHRIPVKIKLIFLLSYILAVVLTPIHFYWLFILYAVLIILTALLSRLPAKFLIHRLQEIAPFILLVLISLPFMYPENRLLIFGRCLIRAVLAGLAMVIITSTAKFNEVLTGLKDLKVPDIFIKLLSFMYRYLFVLEDEFEKMQRSFAARKVTEKQKWFHARSFANMLGVLFIRAYERSERIYLAMCSRGFNGREDN